MNFATWGFRLDKAARLSLTAVCLISVCGCAHIAKFFGLVPERPKIDFASLTIKSMSFASVELEVGIDITNRDRRELELSSLVFGLKFDSDIIGHGKLEKLLKIPPGEKSRTNIPVTIKVAEAAKAAANLLNGATKDNFRIKGSATIGSAFGRLDLPFDHQILN
jgi:hypothetical protein